VESEGAAESTAWRTTGFLYAVLGALGFSFKAVLVKAAYRYGVDPETMLCLRMGYAFPVLLGMGALLQRREPRVLTRSDWRELLLLGALGYYLASYLDFLGLHHVSAALERIVLFIYPTLVTLLSALFLGRPLSARTMRLLLLSYAGVALAVAPDFRAGGRDTLIGCMFVFGSALSYAIYLMRSGQAVQRLGSTRVTALATAIACVLCVAQFLLLRPLTSLVLPWQVHALSIAMALFSTVLPIWLITEAVRRLGASTTAMFGSLGPVFTIFLGWALLSEPFNGVQLAGAAIVIGAVSRLTRR
jgi:drug/metabolite transporter (DMT)-like permease